MVYNRIVHLISFSFIGTEPLYTIQQNCPLCKFQFYKDWFMTVWQSGAKNCRFSKFDRKGMGNVTEFVMNVFWTLSTSAYIQTCKHHKRTRTIHLWIVVFNIQEVTKVHKKADVRLFFCKKLLFTFIGFSIKKVFQE